MPTTKIQNRFQPGRIRKGGVNIRPSSPRPDAPSGQQVSNNKIATIEGTLLRMGYKTTIKKTNDFLLSLIHIDYYLAIFANI
jgi:hypothetical protein